MVHGLGRVHLQILTGYEGLGMLVTSSPLSAHGRSLPKRPFSFVTHC